MSFAEIGISYEGLTQEEKELLLASLYDLGFDSFLEEEDSVKAYIPAGSVLDIHSEWIRSFFLSRNLKPKLTVKNIPQKNWNSEWEKNYNPVIVDNRCAIKTSFHNIPELEYNIVINPEMAFGTGHHETTRMMVRHILDMDIKGKRVLDMGCGTGILGILAAMKGAAIITAIDIDEIAVNNTLANFTKNNIREGFDVIKGDGSQLPENYFDIILANINRNIILKDINNYYTSLKQPGSLVISGLLAEDEPTVRIACEQTGFTYISSSYENRWISLILTR